MHVIITCDGLKKTYTRPVTLKTVFKDIYPNHTARFIAGFVNDQLISLNELVFRNSNIVMIDDRNSVFLQMLKRSCMQLLRRVLRSIWPDVKFADGHITKYGFYCDIDMNYVLKKNDFNHISEKMLQKISSAYGIVSQTVCKKFFLDILKKNNDIYQLEIIKKQAVGKDEINICYHEEYFEFCFHPQVSNIKFCKYFLLRDISGAYWKNNKTNKMLQRIHVIVRASKEKLSKFIFKINQLEQRDHRKISKSLNLYHIQKESPGMVFWHHDGYVIFRALEDFVRNKLNKHNYIEVKSPVIIDKSLWENSGHWKYYQSSIFSTSSENREYCIKPMNCPAHVQIFKYGLKSYKDLPIRMAEFGSCYRKEPSGSLHGLMRVRGFTQDDAHIFCTEEQIKSELNSCIILLLDLYNTFGFKKINIFCSTRPSNRIGQDYIWDQAEQDLESVLKENQLSFQYQSGEGAFYGPKIEISLEDSLNRVWQCGTIQLDFYLSKQLNAFYINKNNSKKNPIIIHRAFLGSIERFIGILIEEYNGQLPLWLCPVQVSIISVSKKNVLSAKNIVQKLLFHKIRVISDFTSNSISLKIRSFFERKIPYILIYGDNEMKNNYLTIRNRFCKKQYTQDIDSFIRNIVRNIQNYCIEDFYMED
ncbi:threonine--tRNA ligase [Buchnera aphidicola]|uniref:Threonine--tRNA ligase n=1 Tax=Buchnera aphidicola (Cinara strobi) TaxID=1921549 RepID=A0A3B1DKT5_9GAMM|nr:threonine--tRNA ligase [Buchnera aphidicola]VAX76331.1 Threonine--tRNA ligase [Buchnera aphidicola (Cinara strobi)]